MKLSYACMLLAAAGTAALSGCKKAEMSGNTSTAMTENSASTNASSGAAGDPVASAESAAPASIAHNASIMTADSSGATKTIRQGTNGWTCMPDEPTTPGPDPMCFDASAAKWVDALMHHKPPPAGTVGMMYMLEGGTDASNTDPYATKPTADNNWVKTPPHVMVVGSKEILAGHPAGAQPDTSVPYVMWAGTPYEHLMIPVK